MTRTSELYRTVGGEDLVDSDIQLDILDQVK